MMRIRIALFILLGVLLGTEARAQPANVAPGPPVQCNASAIYSSSTAGTTQLVPLSTGERIYICGWNIVAVTGATVQLISGTGTNCGSNTTNLTPAFALPTGVFTDSSPFNRGLYTGVGLALCLVQTGTVLVQANIFYGQY